MTKVAFFCETSKYLGQIVFFLTKNLAEFTLFTNFAIDYYNDSKRMTKNSNNIKLYILAVLILFPTSAFAQEENMDTLFDVGHLMAYMVAVLMISVFLMIFFNRVYYYKERDTNMKARRLNGQLALVLGSNKTTVWSYDKQKNVFNYLSRTDGFNTNIMPIDFSQHYDRTDFLEMRKLCYDILAGDSIAESIFVKGAAPDSPTEVQHIYEVDLSIMHRDRHGKPSVILGIQHDITETKTTTENTQKLMLRYHTVFNNSLVDMLSYDADGTMIDINEKACETFGVKDREALLRRKVNFRDIPVYHGVDYRETDSVQFTSIVNAEQCKALKEHVPEVNLGNEMYYEVMVNTIRDEKGQVTGIVVAGRNITEMVESNKHQEESTKLLEQSNRNLKLYVENINYSLKASEVLMMSYNPDNHVLEISSSLDKTLYSLSQLRAITIINESDRRKAKGLFLRMDRRHPGAITNTLRTLMRDALGRDIYLNFNVMPIQDANGRITHYFGMCRNETEVAYTEMKLREETEKAQETEQLKNTFLLNMSYELRTPLSAVVGFAELFNGEHSAEDEPVFAQEIKQNTNELLNKINDILFISRLDARMIEFNYQETDFATLFDSWCYMGWSILPPTVKTVVENPYSQLMARIDSQNLGMVIEKICAFSASQMTEGVVRAKYEYRHGELTITIEDNGRGISKNDLPHVFERFARNEANEHFGSGLDLPIVKELVEQMGGNIEMQSEEGKGLTIFLTIPCESSNFEKKSEIII